MAPEMLRESKYSDKIDVFALGIIMWEVFTGKTPYGDKNFVSLVQLITHVVIEGGRPPSKSVLEVEGVTKTHVALMEDSWHQDPVRRPTAREFSDRVQGRVAPPPSPSQSPRGFLERMVFRGGKDKS